MIGVALRDALSRARARITDLGELHVTSAGVPPPSVQHEQSFIFREFFRNAAGSEDMRVDGSATTQEFYIQADNENDRYIKAISFALAGDAADLSSFISANQGVLTNGVRCYYESIFGEIDIHEGMVDNFDVIRLGGGTPAFGDGATAFQVPGLGPPPAKANGYIPTINLGEMFGMPFGIRLRAGSNQRLVIQIRDDLTHVDNEQFDAIAFGQDRLPE